MIVVMGASGHVGSEVASTLLRRGQSVTILTHDRSHGERWERQGAEIAFADVEDAHSLRDAFRRGTRAFLLNPPADITGDTNRTELRTAANIAAAVNGSGLEKVVLQSTAGAIPGDGIGDSSVLWDLEQRLAALPAPAAINRAGFYMSNWDAQLEAVKADGKLQTMFPADFALPMVAPQDAGTAAADRLMSTTEDVGIRYVEGPSRYSSTDVASAFASALGMHVKVAATPPDEYSESYRKLGFSDAAAEAYSRMTEETLRSDFDFGDRSIIGSTSLQSYISALVEGRSE